MYEIELYATPSGREPVGEYLKDLAKKGAHQDIAQIKDYQKRLKKYGMAVNQIYPKTIRKVDGDVWELRPGKHRVFFFYFTGEKFVLLHAYRKFGQKAPPHEIDKAMQEMKDHKERAR